MLLNLIEAISLPDFIGLSCLDQILRGMVENTPRLTRSQKAQPLQGKYCDTDYSETSGFENEIEIAEVIPGYIFVS